MPDRAAVIGSHRAVREGVLGGNRILKRRGNGRLSVTSMLLDLADPQYHPAMFWVACGEERAPNQHEFVFGIKGKAAEALSLDDVGRPVRVSGVLRSTNGRYGEFTRATVEFTDA